MDCKEMGTKGPWNWRLTARKMIKIMPVRPLMTTLEMTVRDGCAVSACSSPTIYKSSHSCLWSRRGELAFGYMSITLPSTPPVAKIWNKANFPFHHLGLFIGFWAASSWTPSVFREQSHRENHSLVKIFAHPGVTHNNWQPEHPQSS